MNARFKVAIAGEDAGHHQVAILDCLADMVRQRSAVTDARRASVADEIEAQVFKRLEKTTLYQVIRHHFATRCKARLYPWLASETLRCSLLGNKSSADHDVWITGVGAAGDGSNDDVAVGELILIACFVTHGDFAWRDGNSGATFRLHAGSGLAASTGFLKEFRQFALPRRLHFVERNAVLRARWASKARDDRSKININHCGVSDLGGVLAPQHVGLAILLNRLDEIFAAAREAHVIERVIVDREEADGGAVFRSHVGDRCTICQ